VRGEPARAGCAGFEGACVATGHSIRRILYAPATGAAIAELIIDGASRAVDLRPFDPGRFPPLDPKRPHRNYTIECVCTFDLARAT